MPSFPPMPLDQNGAAFLQQMKEFARNFLGWIQEEGQEQEHPQQPGGTVDAHPAEVPQGSTTPGGGAVPMPSAPHEEQQVSPPQLLRTRTTTVHDFTPGAGTPGASTPGATTPGAQTPTAPVNSVASDPGGSKVADDGPEGERFALSPDGRSIVDNRGGKSYSIEEAMQILFSGGDAGPNQVPPAGQVTVTQPNTGINTAKWSMPKIQPPGEDRTDRMGDGEGGAALGRLLDHVSGGNNGMANNGGWSMPKFPNDKGATDYGTVEGARKRAQGGGGSTKPPAAAPQAAAPKSGRHFYERRDESGRVVERVGPFQKDSPQHKQAMQRQMAIAETHNRSRGPGGYGGGGRQLVHPVEE